MRIDEEKFWLNKRLENPKLKRQEKEEIQNELFTLSDIELEVYTQELNIMSSINDLMSCYKYTREDILDIIQEVFKKRKEYER